MAGSRTQPRPWIGPLLWRDGLNLPADSAWAPAIPWSLLIVPATARFTRRPGEGETMATRIVAVSPVASVPRSQVTGSDSRQLPRSGWAETRRGGPSGWAAPD